MKFIKILPHNFCLTASVILFLNFNSFAQPAFKWAKQIVGPSYDRSHAVAIDKNGNVFAAGAYENTMDFDPGPATSNLSSAGLGDIFISRYDAAGNFLWSKTMGGTGMDVAKALTTDPSGNLISAGCFENQIDLDPGTGIVNGGNDGEHSIFISKFDLSGNFIWSKHISSAGMIGCNNVKTDGDGNIYVTGSFKDQVDFNPGAGVTNLIAKEWTRDMFILKLDASGNFLWAGSVAVNCNDLGSSFEIDKSGNIFVTGSFYNAEQVDFDPSAGQHLITPKNTEDVFLLKLNSEGKFLWVNHYTGTFFNGKTSITIDENSNVYMSGNFHKSADVDAGTGSFMLTAGGTNPDAFVTKVDNNGKFLWAKQIGGLLFDESGPITISPKGEVVVTGMFAGTVDFDPGAGNFDLNAAGKYDIFLCKLDTEGNFLCAGSIGGAENERPMTLLFDSNDNLLITGAFAAAADMDPGTGVFNVTPSGPEEVFLCKLGECGIFTGVNETVNPETITVFPNPSNGVFRITNDSDLDVNKSLLTVFNAIGAIIIQIPLKSGNNDLNLTSQPKGIYFVVISDDSKKVTVIKKIVIQ